MSETLEPNSAEGTPDRLSALRRVGGIALLGIVLTLFFVYLGFPYERLAENVAAQVASRSEMTMRFGGAGPQLTWLGPGFELEEVVLVPNRGQAIPLGDVVIRPAWSISWFRGVPAAHIGVSSEPMEASLAIWLDSPMHIEGSIKEFNLVGLTQAGSLNRADLKGFVELEFDLAGSGVDPWQGSVQIRAKNGSFTPPDLGTPIPFESFDSAVILPGDGFIQVESARLDGPALNASGQGRIAWTPEKGTGALDFDFDLEILEPGLPAKLRIAKIPVDQAGKGKLRIGGTLAKPLFH